MDFSPKKLRIAIAQLNPVMGDIAGNLQKARFARACAAQQEADLVLFTELFLSAYPPQDLLFHSSFLESCERALHAFVSDTLDEGPGFIIGVPLRRNNKIYNAYVVADGGCILSEGFKVDLPEYDEFNEKRFFTSGSFSRPVDFRGVLLGVSICEDIWGSYDICGQQKEQGADILLAMNASPFCRGKNTRRYAIVGKRVEQTGLPFLYANQVGGQDELVFDGASFAFSKEGSLVFQMPHFEESIAVTEWQCSSNGGAVCLDSTPFIHRISLKEEADYRACMLGLYDYVTKNKFKRVVLGLSGGIDSIFCSTLAVDTFGADCVQAVMLPFLYTSKQSLEDARQHAARIQCDYHELAIADIVDVFEKQIVSIIGKIDKPSTTYENLQSRTRGTLLMALSNYYGSMLLSTGNKSEMAVGYATLYGDMNGGFNPLKDIYKTDLLALAAWRNHTLPIGAYGREGIVIPESIMRKPASAELSENQFDQDMLPPYPVLDAILACLIEERMSLEEIVRQGYDHSMVLYIENLVFLSEYKRRQAPPGIKLTPRSFNIDRRYPITNFFRGE